MFSDWKTSFLPSEEKYPSPDRLPEKVICFGFSYSAPKVERVKRKTTRLNL